MKTARVLLYELIIQSIMLLISHLKHSSLCTLLVLWVVCHYKYCSWSLLSSLCLLLSKGAAVTVLPKTKSRHHVSYWAGKSTLSILFPTSNSYNKCIFLIVTMGSAISVQVSCYQVYWRLDWYNYNLDLSIRKASSPGWNVSTCLKEIWYCSTV